MRVRRGQHGASPGRLTPAYLLLLILGVLAGVTGAAAPDRTAGEASRPAAPAAVAPIAAAPAEPILPAAAPPAGLQVIDYWTAARGLPADPAPHSTEALTEGLHPRTRLAVYDSPGGRPRAFLPPVISGVPVTVPIVERRAGWVAVLLPSTNRKIGWLPDRGWVSRPLRDQLVLRRGSHELTWIRDGIRRASWTVAVGTKATPTPLGRTFVLARTTVRGEVYAGLDALALGSVPDDPDSVAAGLRGAHTGIHSWYRNSSFGRSDSNGCIRVPKAGQRALLRDIRPGTAVIVLA